MSAVLPASLQGSVGFATLFSKASEAIQRLNDALESGKTITEDGEIEGERREVQIIRPKTEAEMLEINLKEYKHKVVGTPDEIRTYVVNKLVEESQGPRAGDRIKALELIGKIGTIGLFVEKSEKTITHGTTAELESLLRKKIEKIIALDKDDFEEIEEVK